MREQHIGQVGAIIVVVIMAGVILFFPIVGNL